MARVNKSPVQQRPRKAATPSLPRKHLKATFYLPEEILSMLDEAWYQLRKLARPTDRGKISKSLVVEIALQIAIQELHAKAGRSHLASYTASRLAGAPAPLEGDVFLAKGTSS